MTLFYGYKRLVKPEDWKGLAGADNWVAEHSAYELAYAWQEAGGIPGGIANALGDAAAHPEAFNLKWPSLKNRCSSTTRSAHR
jgi:hypothetical protein